MLIESGWCIAFLSYLKDDLSDQVPAPREKDKYAALYWFPMSLNACTENTWTEKYTEIIPVYVLGKVSDRDRLGTKVPWKKSNSALML